MLCISLSLDSDSEKSVESIALSLYIPCTRCFWLYILLVCWEGLALVKTCSSLWLLLISTFYSLA
jgi:hypothetical protein